MDCNIFSKIVDMGGIWIIIYLLCNIALTLYTKWILSSMRFDFPCLLTTIHIGISGIGGYIVYKIMGITGTTRKRSDEFWLLLKFSIIYTLNIAINNISLSYVSLAFHQIIRSMSPLFTVSLEYIFRDNIYTPMTYISLIPIMFGVILTTFGEGCEITFDMIGIILTVVGVLLAASKSIITNALLRGDQPFHTVELLWKLAPFCCIECLIMGYFFNEFDNLASFNQKYSEELKSIYFKVFLNGLLAFFLNWTGFISNKITSPLAMNVAGNIKQCLSIIIGIWLFGTLFCYIDGVGIFITFIGGVWFSYLSYKNNSRIKSKLSDENLGNSFKNI